MRIIKIIQQVTNQDENLLFCKRSVFCYLAKTITKSGHCARKNCSFLLSQIPSIGLDFLHLFKVEFAVRLRVRAKAEFIRTNKNRRLFAVVDTLPPLTKGDTSNTISKRENTMNTQTLSYSVIASTAGNTEQPNGISFIIAHGKPHSEAAQIARQAMDENPQFSEISVIPMRELERMNGAKLAEIENRQAIEPFNRNETEA